MHRDAEAFDHQNYNADIYFKFHIAAIQSIFRNLANFFCFTF